jgi:hypothetical protein
MQIIPLTSDGAQRVRVTLTGGIGTYVFRSYWNYTASRWFMDILDIEGTPLIEGIALVPGPNIIRGQRDIESIFTDFRILLMSGQNDTTDSLGSTAFLAQFDEGEYDTLFPPESILPGINTSLSEAGFQ